MVVPADEVDPTPQSMFEIEVIFPDLDANDSGYLGSSFVIAVG